MDVQTIATIVFIFLMAYFIFRNWARISIQKIAFPILYFAMYKTKIGLGFMNKVSGKFPRLVKWAGYAGVSVALLGMAFISYSLVMNIVKMFITPAATSGVALVLPFKVKGSFYVPFFYWIISIFLLAVVHEFSHGVIARAHGVKIKSSGFGFLAIIAPILPLAFVEPDEDELQKKKTGTKLSVYAAGPFSNIVFAAVVALIFWLLFMPLGNAIFEPSGVEVAGYIRGHDNTTYPAEASGIAKGEIITAIDGNPVQLIDNFTSVLNSKNPGDSIVLQTNVSSYTLTLVSDPEDSNRSYMGIYLQQNNEIRESFQEKYGVIATSSLIWVIGLFYWLYVLNLGIGLFNLVPLGPIDGGRMLKAILERYLREDIAAGIWKFVSFVFLAIIVASIVLPFVR